ncbi:MAG: hypothetical protein HY669_00685 [Chloroflexi bacterium]|nr:hypothetical protein [Chloroflexota bacterium]
MADTDTELKVVLQLKEGHAMVGVQEKDSDPVMERIQAADLPQALAALPAVLERAMARWDQARKNPTYQRPPEPAMPPPARTAVTAAGAGARRQEPREGQMQRLV